ncbi:hypothetical protein ABZX98_16355 [Streptomyces sp. NPDC002992]|uniref:hypothetical protein n=1 Tax=Streptomyces sp. NPDC002992 TaxID=3154273 RepID=UPI0033B81C6C
MNENNNPHDVLDARARDTVGTWPVSSMPWHEATAPKRVHEAHAALREALTVADSLHSDFRELRSADERQEQERRKAHAAHLAGGPAPKAYKRVDYLAQREDKLLALQAAHQRARVLRSQYDALETDPKVLAEERDTLVKALAGEHARMAELVVEAERAYQRFATVKDRAEYLSQVLGDVEAPEGMKYASDDVADGSEWGAILRVAHSTDPRVTGEWIVSAFRDARTSA